MGTLDDEINAQVCHLIYERKSSPAEKLDGYQMLRVKQAIDAEIRRFQEQLETPYCKFWTPRQPNQQRGLNVQYTSDSTTSVMTLSMTATYNVNEA